LSFSPTGSKRCIAGKTIAFLDGYGDVMPGNYLPLSAGNVYKKISRDLGLFRIV
jgi:hypothetical protein